MNVLKHKSLKFITLSVLLLILNQAYCQSDSTLKKIFGISLDLNYSRINHEGISPSLTITSAKHQFKFGPRLLFSRLRGHTYTAQPRLVLDLDYRYDVYNLGEKTKIFAEVKLEYLYNYYDYEFDYDLSIPSTSGISLGFDPFHGQLDYWYHQTNLYVGGGVEYKLFKNLYTSASIGLGAELTTYQRVYTNLDINEIVLDKKGILKYTGLGYFTTLTMGYRFGS